MSKPSLRPSSAIRNVEAYGVQRGSAPIDLRLDGNEGLRPDAALLDALAQADAELLRRYPSTAELRALLAERLDTTPEHVVATCGGDDALDRAFRAMLEPGREVVLPVPTFEMFHHYARWRGATVRTIEWSEPEWPRQAVLEAITPDTAVIALVSPNNPSGYVVTEADLRAVAAAAPHALVVLDHAYVEFADEDLTPLALTLPNVLVFRTLSKAWGLAGLRVGYAAGAPELIGWLEAAGNPYTVTGPSAWLAAQALRAGGERMADFVSCVRRQRGDLEQRLDSLGLSPTRSQGNFAFARTPRADWLREALASLGIGVRGWPGVEGLADGLRFTLPGNDADYERLVAGIECALRPDALLLDMDGVLADVRHSYRAAIVQTCAAFGVQVTPADVQRVKDAGDANNDWVVSQRLMAARGADVPLDEVTRTFEALYQGTESEPGLRAKETLLIDRATLEAMRQRVRLAVVTGRPRHDALAFLRAHDLTDLFDAIVCMEDAPAKPDPAPVRLALQQLGVARAWMLGDTPDDAVSARAAGVVAVGVAAPGDEYAHADEVLRAAGAARVLERPADIQELLP